MGCGGDHPLDGSPGEARGDFGPLFPTGWRNSTAVLLLSHVAAPGVWPGLTQGPTAPQQRAGRARRCYECRAGPSTQVEGKKPKSTSDLYHSKPMLDPPWASVSLPAKVGNFHVLGSKEC